MREKCYNKRSDCIKEDDGIKPILKWAGGKRQLLPEIRKRIPYDMDIYFEPFVGAGAVFLDCIPKKAYINDTNSQLIETYVAIKDCPDELIEALKRHSANNNKDYFYEIRGLDRQDDFKEMSLAERAARLIYLNKTCYNGLYRVNLKGNFNVPYGRYKNPMICEEENILKISNYLNREEIVFLNSDFADSTNCATENSFVYFDPPYYYENKENFTNYQAEGFREKEHIRLHDHICDLTKRGVRCLLSNSDAEFVRELYSGFEIETVQAIRPINSKVSGRGKVNEVLIRNYALS